MLDPEDWKIVFEVYREDPILALALAQQFTAIRQSLEQGRKGIPDAIEALDLAVDSLYSHSDFHTVSHNLYRRNLKGPSTLRRKKNFVSLA